MSKGEVLHYSEKIGYCFIRPDDGDESIFVQPLLHSKYR